MSDASFCVRCPHSARQEWPNEWPLWEVFVRSKSGLDHKHCGSLHAADAKMAIQMARDVYTRRQEGTSVWVVRSDTSSPAIPATRACTSIRPKTRCTATRPSTSCPKSVDHM
jgi:ring-1,2-phenylacetyl-CoA epoxidase subunit PaaB